MKYLILSIISVLPLLISDNSVTHAEKVVFENDKLRVMEVAFDNELVKSFVNQYDILDSESLIKAELMISKASDQVKIVVLEDSKGNYFNAVFDGGSKIIGSYQLNEMNISSNINRLTIMTLDSRPSYIVDYDVVSSRFLNFVDTEAGPELCGDILEVSTCKCLKKAVEACSDDWECAILCGATGPLCIGAMTIACILADKPE